MSEKLEPKLKSIIRDYLIDTELKETLHDPKLDLGFRFLFPKGNTPQGKPTGRPFTVVKTKQRNVLEISSPVNIAKEHVKILNSMEKLVKDKFLRKLTKTFLLK